MPPRFAPDTEAIPNLDDSRLSAFGRRILDLSYASYAGIHGERELVALTDQLVSAIERFLDRLHDYRVPAQELSHHADGIAIFEEYLELADSYDQLPHEQVVLRLGRLESRLFNHLLVMPAEQLAA